MDKPLMFRRRYMPQETKSLNDDEILFMSDEMIVTRWNTFKPKKEFSKGISCTFMNRGYKISRFMKDNGELVYYYCDIIHSDYDSEKNTWIFTDLLADVKIYPDGFVEVVDLGEVSEAFENGLIGTETVTELLKKLDSLLQLIYSGKWRELTDKYFD
ncbi:MAG: DUF402 domain-containing protein [Clostridia bacterium]|nr:DUF402 domain-containing protein [Clostridia bacterium]